MATQDFSDLTARIRALVASGRYQISNHVLQDHPERKIFASNILDVFQERQGRRS